MIEPVDVVIAIPARNEVGRISACLSAVLRAVGEARRSGAVARVIIAVAADRCDDGTALLARTVLENATRAMPDVSAVVWESREALRVGAVRTRLIDRALPADAEGWWIFSTDADSVVPADWLITGCALAVENTMIIGLIDLDGAEPPWLAHAHDQLVRAGIHPDGTHDHVYAANLAIRSDVFRSLGGFPAVPQGEEQALLDAARDAGHQILTTASWRVRTSSRTRSRARGGLGDLLNRLAQREERAG